MVRQKREREQTKIGQEEDKQNNNNNPHFHGALLITMWTDIQADRETHRLLMYRHET